MSKDKILTACYQLLEEGKSVTVRAVIDKVGGSTRDVSPVVKEFKEKLEAASSIAVSEQAEVDTNHSGKEDRINTDSVAANLERVDREAQLIAARKIIATAYYEKTQQFNLPGLQEEVNQALSEVDAITYNQDETLSPKGMLNWLKTKQPTR